MDQRKLVDRESSLVSLERSDEVPIDSHIIQRRSLFQRLLNSILPDVPETTPPPRP